MKKKLLMIVFLCCIQLYADSEREQAIGVAQAGYKKFVAECLTPAGRAVYQLTPFENASTASLGEAIEVLDLTPEAIVNYTQGSGVSGLLQPRAIRSWYFPVYLNGQMKLILGVFKPEGGDHYEIGSLGSVWLAKELARIKEQCPYSKEHRMIYAECYEANSCVFTFPDLDDRNLSFFDIAPGRRSSYSQLSTVDAAVKIMQGNIHESIKEEIQKGVNK